MVYAFFSYYICRVWENGEIKRYVYAARTEREGAEDIYVCSEALAKRCKEKEEQRDA
jgi:hypothetical protein